MDLLQNCEECYVFKLSEYIDTVVIKAGLSADTNYILKVTDQFGNKFSTGAITSAGDGSLTIPVPDSFPKAWFNRNNGRKKFELSLTAQPWAPVNLTFNTVIYTCIVVEFISDDAGVNIIQ